MDHNEGHPPRSIQAAATSRGAHVRTLLQPWLRLSEELSPLIGESGFCALFGRALRLSAVRFEPLGACMGARSMHELFGPLTSVLNEMEPEQATSVNGVLLDTFTTLMANLIGEALTKQLLSFAQEGGTGSSMTGAEVNER
jgi:hypothetical protein